MNDLSFRFLVFCACLALVTAACSDDSPGDGGDSDLAPDAADASDGAGVDGAGRGLG